MKLFCIILHLILLMGCSNSNHKLYNFNEKELLEVKDSVPSIGNCYVYAIKKDTVLGMLLAGISREDDSIYYSFIISGKLFKTVPTKEEFRNAGLAGLSVPGPNPGDYQKTFCRYTITEKRLAGFLPKMIIMGKISDLSNRNEFGSTRSFEDFENLSIEYILFEKWNAEYKEQAKQINLPMPIHQNFDWSSLQIATNEDEIAKEETIWILSRKTAHPAAAKLMTEEWFWSPIDDLSPFGNDNGSDAFHIFKDWREHNLQVEPAQFLDVLEKRWNMSFAHKNIISEKELVFVEQTNQYYRNIDMAIIGIAFGQIVLEGKISKELKDYGIKAIQRTMLPIGMEGMNDVNKEEYKRRLKIMLDILNQF